MKKFKLYTLFLTIGLISSCGNYTETNGLNESFDPRLLASTTISFETVKSSIFGKNCVSCHQQYNEFSGVKKEISAIIDSVENNRMPKNAAPLSPAQKGLLKAWFDKGAPEFADGSSSNTENKLTPDWNSLSKNVFIPKCIVCHNPNGQAKFLDLSSRQRIFDQRNRDFDGQLLIHLDEPENSYLVQIIQDPVEPMPPLESRLPQVSAEELKAIKEWIKLGLP